MDGTAHIRIRSNRIPALIQQRDGSNLHNISDAESSSAFLLILRTGERPRLAYSFAGLSAREILRISCEAAELGRN